MSDVNVMVDSKVSASGEAKSLAIEKFDGQVRMAYTENTGFMSYFDLQQVQGTNTISNKYFGVTSVQALAPGKDVEGSEAEFDKNSLVIDTSVIARNVVGHLADVQDDIDTKGKLAKVQVEAIVDLENRMLCQQGIYGAISNTEAKRTKPRVSGHGFSTIKLIKETEVLFQPNKLMAALEWVLEEMVMQNTPLDGLTIFMPWPEFNCLRDAERVQNAMYTTTSGTDITGFVLKSYNVPVVPTTAFPNKARDHKDKDGVVSTHHLLSNVNNGYRYDVKNTVDGENQEKCSALIIGREGLLVGRSIELQGNIWFNDGNKSWYIDSWMAEGAIPDRWEHLAAVMKATTETDGLQARTDRKAPPVQTVSTESSTAAFVAAVQAILAAQP